MRVVLMMAALAWSGLALADDGGCTPDRAPVRSADGGLRCVTVLVDFTPVAPALSARRSFQTGRWVDGVVDRVPGARTLDGFLDLAPGLDRHHRFDGQALVVRLDGMELIAAPGGLGRRLPGR